MKITYISHATLLIEIEGVKILTDPWIAGPAYCEQWYVFPKPIENYQHLLNDIDYILISHGHEDHLHYDTLKLVNKNAHVFFPYTWYEGSVDFFNGLGFKNVTEAKNEYCYNLKKNIEVTFLANNLDNVIVIKSKDRVLVDINDALPSAPQGIISHFIQKIKRKWNKVDYLFSSYGGASYFPNTIKCEWKNDEEIGAVREQFFLDNFCKIAAGINATYSIPFASDFVLLDEQQRWMNRVKIKRSGIKNYFESHYLNEKVNTQMKECYAGDIITDDDFILSSPYHEKFRNNTLDEIIEKEYANEIAAKKVTVKLNKEEIEKITVQVEKHIANKFHIIPLEKRKQLKFAIQITDATDKLFIEVDLTKEKPATILKTEFSPDNVLLLKIKSQSLLYSISNEWGGDAIIIGYGCEITVFKKETIINQLENWTIQLLTNYPNTKEYIKKNPLRALNYLAKDNVKRKIFLKKLTGAKTSGSPFTDERLSDTAMWLTRSNCDICKKCNIPVLTEKEAAYLL